MWLSSTEATFEPDLALHTARSYSGAYRTILHWQVNIPQAHFREDYADTQHRDWQISSLRIELQHRVEDIIKLWQMVNDKVKVDRIWYKEAICNDMNMEETNTNSATMHSLHGKFIDIYAKFNVTSRLLARSP